MAFLYWIFFGSSTWSRICQKGTIYNWHVFHSFALYIVFMSSRNSFCEFLNIQERFHFFGWLFSIELSLVLLFGHRFDTRGLVITCDIYFLCTRHSCLAFEEFFFRVHKRIGMVSFFWMAFLHWTFIGSTTWSWIWQ